MKKIFIYILTFLSIIICMPLSTHRIKAAIITEDYYNCSVTDQLEKLEVSTDDYNDKVISMTQFYDDDKVLHSYLYINDSVSFLGNTLYVNISTAVADSYGYIKENFNLYKLTYIEHEIYDQSSSNCYARYEIEDLPNLQYSTRRYYVKSYGIKTNPVSRLVDKVFIFNGIHNSQLKVFTEEREVIEVTKSTCGFYCYGDDYGILDFAGYDDVMEPNSIYTDAWYVFFNINKEVDELLDVELTYTEYYYDIRTVGPPYMDHAFTESWIEENRYNTSYIYNGDVQLNYCEPVVKRIPIGTRTIVSADKNWFGKYSSEYHELDNIINLKEKQQEFKNSGKEYVFDKYVNDYTWGVCFADTIKTLDYKFSFTPNDDYTVHGSGMSDTAILRLSYRKGSSVRDCYVVDIPKQDFEGNTTENDKKNNDLDIEKILKIIFGLLALSFLLPIINPILKVIGNIFEMIFDGFLSIIKKPFKKKKKRNKKA